MITQKKTFGFSVARRRTRRFVIVAYWCVMTAVCIGFLYHQHRHGADDLSFIYICQCLFFLAALLGGIRSGGFVKPFRGVHFDPMMESGATQTLFAPPGAKSSFDDSALDERETRERDRVHFVAYTLMRWFTLALFAIYALLGALHLKWFAAAGPFFLFLLTLTMWSLPQTLILWTEPDLEEPA